MENCDSFRAEDLSFILTECCGVIQYGVPPAPTDEFPFEETNSQVDEATNCHDWMNRAKAAMPK